MFFLITNGNNYDNADRVNLFYKKDKTHYKRNDGPAWNLFYPCYVLYNKKNRLLIYNRDDPLYEANTTDKIKEKFYLLNSIIFKEIKIDII